MNWYLLKKDYDGKKTDEKIQLEDKEGDILVKAGILEKTDEAPEKDAAKEAIAEFQAGVGDFVKKSVTEAIRGLKISNEDGDPIRIKTRERVEDDPYLGYGSELDLPQQTADDLALGQYAADVRTATQKGAVSVPERLQKAQELLGKAAQGHQELVGEDGGFLVLPNVSNRIMAKVWADVDMLTQIDMITLTQGNSLELNSLVEDSRVAGSRHGGVRGYWVGEAGALTKSKSKHSKINLRLNKLAVLTHASDELLEDASIGLGGYLGGLAAREIAFMLGDVAFNGLGATQPRGSLQAGCKVEVTRGTANKIEFADILAMWKRIHVRSRSTGQWYVNQDAEPELWSLFIPFTNVAGSENVGGFPAYMPPGGLSGNQFGTILGRPVRVVEWAETLGTTGDLSFVDFSQFVGIRKGGVNAATSIHLYFETDETAFRWTMRVDWAPWWAKAVTPFKGSNTVSPVVVLKSA